MATPPNSYTAFGQNSSEGGFGGGQIGFNIQRDRLVYGIEADIQGADLDASRDVSPNDSPATKNGYFSDARVEEQLDWFGSVRGRVGLVPWQNILVYVTGGVAFGGVQDSLKETNYQSYNYRIRAEPKSALPPITTTSMPDTIWVQVSNTV